MTDRLRATPAGSLVAAPKADWLAAMIRNYLEQDEALREAGSVVVQLPGDPQSILVIQPGANHVLIQVNPAEVVV